MARVGGGGGGGKGESGKSGAAAFFDEDGVVDDMDGYLNYLSLEYDSVWDTKPAWSVPLLLRSRSCFLLDAALIKIGEDYDGFFPTHIVEMAQICYRSCVYCQM